MPNQNNISDTHLDSVGTAGTIADNIARTVDKAALRKVCGLVDEEQEKAAIQQRQQKWLMLGGMLVVFLALAYISAQKAPMPVAETVPNPCVMMEKDRIMATHLVAMRREHPDLHIRQLIDKVAQHNNAAEQQAEKTCGQPANLPAK